MFCWCACTYACVFGYATKLEWFNAFSSLSATPMQCWISVFNPLVTMLTVMPYRRAVLKPLVKISPIPITSLRSRTQYSRSNGN